MKAHAWLEMFTYIIIIIFSGCNAYHIVYLDTYPGNLKLIELSDLTVDTPTMVDLTNAIDITPNTPDGTTLSNRCGNPDVSPDGTKIVFGAITPNLESWDIYIGDLNVASGTIDNIQIIINTDYREEDPRFSYDGNSFVYKSGKSWITPIVYDIVLYDMNTQQTTTVVACPSDCDGICTGDCNHCELWGPAYHPCGNKISYTARLCDNSVYNDEIYIYDMDTQEKERVTDNTMPDMYSHWKRDGTLLFSRKRDDTGTDDLYLYDENTTSISLFLSETQTDVATGTTSDDDAYAFKQDNDLVLFIGLADSVEGYELYIWRDGIEYQMTSEREMLGPVVFSLDIAVTTPAHCTDNEVTTMAPLTSMASSSDMDVDTTGSSTTLNQDSSCRVSHWILCLVHAFCFCVYQLFS